MPTPILVTKLLAHPLPPTLVPREHLIERLNAGLHRGLTLVSAPAGFGKTTLLSAWVAGLERPTAWLSLDEGDNEPGRFLTYLIAALQTIVPTLGNTVLAGIPGPQPPAPSVLAALVNEISTVPESFVLVLDDYHVIDATAVDLVLTFLLEHVPAQMHLVISTRQDPNLPLARLHAGGHLTEVRAADLRFTPAEAAEFLNSVMGLSLSPHFFVVALDDPRHWYRYHHLFAEVLRAYLTEEQPDRVSTLHRRASEWYELNGSPADAIRHALAAADFEHVADLIERAGPAMQRNRQEATLLGWLRALPDQVFHPRPVLSAAYGGVLLANGELEGVESRLRDAERWLDAPADPTARPDARSAEMVVVDETEFRRLPAQIAVWRAGIAQVIGRGDDTVRYARRALDLVGADDHLVRGAAVALIGARVLGGGRSRGGIPDVCREHRRAAASRKRLGRARLLDRAGRHSDRARLSPRGDEHSCARVAARDGAGQFHAAGRRGHVRRNERVAP